MQSSLRWIAYCTPVAVLLGLAVAVYDSAVPAGLFVLIVFGVYLLTLLRYPERGLWLLALALPYERLATVPTGLLTVKLGHVVAAFMLASWTARSVLTRTWHFVANPLRIPLLLLFGAGALSLVNALNPHRTVTLLIQLLIGVLIYWLTINFLSRRNLKGTVLSLWAGAAVVAVFGIYQFVGDFLGLPANLTGLSPQYTGEQVFGFARVQGPSLEPLYFANYLLLPICTAAAYLFGLRQKVRWWLVPFLFLLVVAFVLTLARGAYLGLAVGGLLIVIAYIREIFTPRVLLALGGILTAGLLTVAVLLASTSNGQERPVDTFLQQIGIVGNDVSSQQRFSSTGAAIELIPDHPFIGVGLGNFGEYYQDPQGGGTGRTQVVNNQTLEILVETGIIGLLALLSIAYVLVYRSAQAWRAVAADRLLKATLVGTGAAVVAMFVQAQTFSALYLIHIWFAIGLLVGVQNLILLPKKEQPA